MITLTDKLAPLDVQGLLTFARSLDPNSSWDEWLAEDPEVDADTLRAAMLHAYDDADVHAWINR